MADHISEDELRAMTWTWDYDTLPANVRLGDDCRLERRDSFSRYRSRREVGLRLGARVVVYTWTTFNLEADAVLEVGDDSVLVGAVFMCAGDIRLGARVVVSYNVTIADADFHPLDPDLRMADAIANAPSGDRSRRPPYVTRPVVIEDDVWIGIGAIILKGVRIGRGARVEAGAVVTADVAEGLRVAGNPARVIAPRA